ncbi:MAG TPA: hypothetical protein PK677_07315 [Acidiphilium sp.]|nr:MAG: hypothetical protein B7Z67_13040 [Acidiphilium sp. 21-60-14]OZB39154.1 MAG: hypothetical protein B7X48_09970 [Acidiphilium sp. 34-60-192]HQT88351.1 hypothetical protein [Acidiphilium sp.]HQU25031.1 hypothetical protein [Acidiphilium sp.]
MPRFSLLLFGLIAPLAACSFNAPPQSASQQADAAVCTKQADAINEARHFAHLSRPDQFATPLSGSPDPQYISNHLAQLHARDDRIQRCIQLSNPAFAGSGATLPTPRIIGPSS